MKWLAEYIMRGRLQAMLVTSTLAMMSLLLAPLSILSSAAVALVTLRRGAYEGLIVLICSSFSAAVLVSLTQIGYQIIPLFVIFMWLPVWLIAVVLREGRHIKLAVDIAVLIGFIGVVGYYFFNTDPTAIWKQIMPKMVPTTVPADKVQQAVDVLASYMTGIFAAGIVFSMSLGLFLGRWWQAVLYNPGGFKQEFLGLKAESKTALLSFAIMGLAMASSGKISQIAWNSVILVLVIYIFTGISVLHNVLAKLKTNQYMMPIFYILLFLFLTPFAPGIIGIAVIAMIYTVFSKTEINYTLAIFYITLFFIPPSLLPVALVGFSDTWLDIRKRILN